MLTARDVSELLIAEEMGLIPDPWLQTGQICKTIYDMTAKEDGAPTVEPETFRVRFRR